MKINLTVGLILGVAVSLTKASGFLQDHLAPTDFSRFGNTWLQEWVEHGTYKLPSSKCCFCLAQDGNCIWVGTSAGALRYTPRDDVWELFKVDDDWGMEYAVNFGAKNPTDEWWRDKKKQKEFAEKWMRNSVEKIVVLSPGNVWVDMVTGVMVIQGDRKTIYPFVQDALEAIYHSPLRATLSKVVDVDKAGRIWWLKEEWDKSYIIYRDLHCYDGTAWKRDEGIGFKRSSGDDPNAHYIIDDVLADAQGNLWACDLFGIYLYQANSWTRVLEDIGYNQLRLGTGGIIWAFGDGVLARHSANKWEVIRPQETLNFRVWGNYGLPLDREEVVLETSDNKLWFTAYEEVDMVSQGKFWCFDGTNFSQVGFSPTAAVIGPKGQAFAVSGGSILCYEKGKWNKLPRPKFPSFKGGDNSWLISDILVSNDNKVFIATPCEGLLEYQKGTWKRKLCDKEKTTSKQEMTEAVSTKSEVEQFFSGQGSGIAPPALIEQCYRGYMEGEGKQLIKATDQQLAEHIANSENKAVAISYYRLLCRKKENVANAALYKRIINMNAGDTKVREFLPMEIASYGEPAATVLLDVVKNGTPEQCILAINAIGSMGSSKLIDKLFGVLSYPNKLDARYYYPLVIAAISNGDQRGMELLIELATGERPCDPNKQDASCQRYRALLEKAVKGYDDIPSDWSVEKWKLWWKKHRSNWKPSGDLYALPPATATAMQKVYKAVAEKIEK